MPAFRREAAALGLFLLYLVALAPFALPGPLTMYAMSSRSQRSDTMTRELETLYAAYPTAEMGVSDNERFPLTYARVLGVLRGTPVHLDVPFFLDLNRVDEGSREAERLVEHCVVREWILPAGGEPFAFLRPNSFTEREGSRDDPPLFTERFRQAFQENYRIVFEGQFYDVWACLVNREAAPAKP